MRNKIVLAEAGQALRLQRSDDAFGLFAAPIKLADGLFDVAVPHHASPPHSGSPCAGP